MRRENEVKILQDFSSLQLQLQSEEKIRLMCIPNN